MNASEEIYKLYPRHVGKKAALMEIQKALSRLREEMEDEGIYGDPIAWLKTRVWRFANSPAGNRGIYTPHPSTWFHQSRYLDDEAEWELMSDREQENVRRYREANVGVWRP